MAFDGAADMVEKSEALTKAAEVQNDLRSIERAIAWGKRNTEGDGLLHGALTVAEACAVALHRSLEAVAGLTGEHFQTEDFALYSGGDDKPPPPPPEG
jgi:hypothetical protein